VTNDQPSVIQRFVRVVPEAVWLALAGALLLAAVAGAAAVWSGARVRRQSGRFAEMSVAALTDPLTGLLNRRGFIEAADRELERARRYGRPLAIAYVDVQGLKAVNDTEGHLAGDRLLCATARLLTDSARANDVVGRLGGDEMGVLLVEQTPEGAEAATSRIEAEVLDRRAAIGLRSRWDLTVGTSTFPEDGETVDELLRAADLRLYEQRGIEIR
jgi:diguanylate cyclase (GGDEF)-like protein